jgi:hypothetical protein
MPGIFIHVILYILFSAALLSFTLLLHDFLQRRGMDWEKVCQADILYGDFWEFWHIKGEVFFGKKVCTQNYVVFGIVVINGLAI